MAEENINLDQAEVQDEKPQPKRALYQRMLADKLYSKTYEDFESQFSTPEKVSKLYDALKQRNLYDKSAEAFGSQFFSDVVKKKEVSAPASKPISETFGTPSLNSLPTEQSKSSLPYAPVADPSVRKEMQDQGGQFVRADQQAKVDQLNPFGQKTADQFAVSADRMKDVVLLRKKIESGIATMRDQAAVRKAELDNPNSDYYKSLAANTTRQERLNEAMRNDKGSRTGFIVNGFLKGIGRNASGINDLMANVFSSLGLNNGMSNEETMKSVRASNNMLREAPEKVLGAAVSDRKANKYNEEFFTGALRGVTESVPAMLTPKGVGLYLPAYDNAIEQINQSPEGAKLPEWAKTTYGATVGIAQGALEKVGLESLVKTPAVLRNISNKLLGKAFTQLGKDGTKAITAEAVDQIVTAEASLLSRKIRQVGSQALSGFMSETVTGTTQEVSQVLTELATNHITGKKVFDVQSFGDTVGRIIRSGLQEGVGGIVFGAGVGSISATEKQLRNDIAAATTSEDIASTIQSAISNFSNNPDLTPADVQELTEKANKYAEVAATLPPDMQPTQKVASMDLIVTRNSVDEAIAQKQTELENTDEAFKGRVENELSVLTDQRKLIDKQLEEVNKSDLQPEKPETAVVNTVPAEEVQTPVAASGAEENGTSAAEVAPVPEEAVAPSGTNSQTGETAESVFSNEEEATRSWARAETDPEAIASRYHHLET